MDKSKILADSHTYLITRIRTFEVTRAQGDEEKLKELADTTDAMLLRSCMWKVTIIGGPICFIAVPFVLAILTPFVWQPLMVFLWIVARIAMGLVFIIFLLAIYFTTSKTFG
ncbi:MAG: hypothetical protein ACRD3W_21710 [Terriglobales bacterium]